MSWFACEKLRAWPAAIANHLAESMCEVLCHCLFCFQRQSVAMGGHASKCGALKGLSQGLVLALLLLQIRTQPHLGCCLAAATAAASAIFMLLCTNSATSTDTSRLAWFLKCIGVLSCEEMDMCNPPDMVGHGSPSRSALGWELQATTPACGCYSAKHFCAMLSHRASG
jgi:hypothetical protein